MTYPTHAELVVRLRLARAARPPSLMRQTMDDPALYQRLKAQGRERARLFDQNWSDTLKRMQADAVAEADGLLSYDDVARFEGDAEPTEPVRRTRMRRASLTNAIRAATKAGATVSGATITADGSVVLTFSDGSTTTSDNPWDRALKNAAH